MKTDMKKSESKSINVNDFLRQYAEHKTDGRLDIQATHLKFTSDLTSFDRSTSSDSSVIAAAVKETFSERGYATLGMRALLHFVMGKLEFDDESFNSVQSQVQSYIRQNTGNLFKVGKGAKGGVSWINEEDPDFQSKAAKGTSSDLPVAKSVPSPAISEAPPAAGRPSSLGSIRARSASHA